MSMIIKMVDHMHQIFLSCMSFSRKRKGYNMYWLSYTRFEFTSFDKLDKFSCCHLFLSCQANRCSSNKPIKIKDKNLYRIKIQS